jgi:antitoxin PrlF
MKRMKARVTERGQVTIPKPLRNRLGVKPGTILEFSEERGRLIAVKCDDADPVTEVYGCLGKKINTDAVMAQLRGRRLLRAVG